MTAMETLVREQQNLVLQDSIYEQRHLLVTKNGPLGWRTFKASFVSGCARSGELTVRVIIPDNMESSSLPQPGDTLGAAFRMGHKKCMFRTELVSSRVSAGEATFIVRWPAQMRQLKRRAYERAAPPRDQVVAVRFWCEAGESNPMADARTVRHGQLEDISCGGMQIKVANTDDLEMEATYKCVLVPRPGKPSLLLEGILRHREAVEHGRASLGIQFVGLETSNEGMRTLDRLARSVSHFQRSKGRGAPQNDRDK